MHSTIPYDNEMKSKTANNAKCHNTIGATEIHIEKNQLNLENDMKNELRVSQSRPIDISSFQ